MVDFLNDLYPRRRGKAVATDFAALLVVVGAVELIGAGCGAITLGDLDGGDLEVVLGLSGGVRSKQEAMCGVRLRGIPIRT